PRRRTSSASSRRARGAASAPGPGTRWARGPRGQGGRRDGTRRSDRAESTTLMARGPRDAGLGARGIVGLAHVGADEAHGAETRTNVFEVAEADVGAGVRRSRPALGLGWQLLSKARPRNRKFAPWALESYVA